VKKNIFFIAFIFSVFCAFSQVPNDNIYGDYKIDCEGCPYSRMFVSIDGTLYLFQDKNTNPTIYVYDFIDNLMFIGNAGYYYSFKKENDIWVLTIIPAFGEAGYNKVVCYKLGSY